MCLICRPCSHVLTVEFRQACRNSLLVKATNNEVCDAPAAFREPCFKGSFSDARGKRAHGAHTCTNASFVCFRTECVHPSPVYPSRVYPSPVYPSRAAQIDALFASFDADGSGLMDFKELKPALRALQDAAAAGLAEAASLRSMAEDGRKRSCVFAHGPMLTRPIALRIPNED